MRESRTLEGTEARLPIESIIKAADLSLDFNGSYSPGDRRLGPRRGVQQEILHRCVAQNIKWIIVLCP